MRRRRRDAYGEAGYPRPTQLPDRRQVLAGLAAVAGGGALAALNWGCVGDIAYPDHTVAEFTLPPAPETRQVVLADGLALTYHLERVVGTWDMDSCLQDPRAEDEHAYHSDVYEAMDTVLLAHESTAFADGADLSAIEADLARAICAACVCGEEPWDAVLSLDLVVDDVETA